MDSGITSFKPYFLSLHELSRKLSMKYGEKNDELQQLKACVHYLFLYFTKRILFRNSEKCFLFLFI